MASWSSHGARFRPGNGGRLLVGRLVEAGGSASRGSPTLTESETKEIVKMNYEDPHPHTRHTPTLRLRLTGQCEARGLISGLWK